MTRHCPVKFKTHPIAPVKRNASSRTGSWQTPGQIISDTNLSGCLIFGAACILAAPPNHQTNRLTLLLVCLVNGGFALASAARFFGVLRTLYLVISGGVVRTQSASKIPPRNSFCIDNFHRFSAIVQSYSKYSPAPEQRDAILSLLDSVAQDFVRGECIVDIVVTAETFCRLRRLPNSKGTEKIG